MKKFNDEFNKEELKIIEDAIGRKIINKNYSYDEVSNMKINVKWCHNSISNSKRRNIVGRLNDICKEYDENFSFKDWKHKLVYNTKDLNHIIDSYNIINKKIESIFLTDDTTLYKDSMVTGYNNSNELSNLPNWKIMKRITEDMIPDKLERSNLAYINSPLVIVFDDTTTLELYLKGYSRAYISHNQLKEKYKYNFDIKNAFKKILNHKIIKYAIMKYSPEHSDCYYIDKRIKNNDNIWYITFYLDNEIELRFYPDFCVLMENNGKDPMPITIGEWKKYVKHYDWLFDKKSEPRYSNNEKATRKLTNLEKKLIIALNHTNISKRARIDVVMSCEGNEEIYSKVLEYIMGQYNSGKIEEITESKLLRVILMDK